MNQDGMAPSDTETGLWLDPTSPSPLHVQLRTRIEALILAGVWEPGRPIPSSRELATTLGVSRGTVITACQELVASGMLVSRPRSAMVVAPSARRRNEYPLRGERETSLREVRASGAVDPELERAASPRWEELILPVAQASRTFASVSADYVGYPYPFVTGQVEARDFPARAWAQAMNSALDGPHLVASLRDNGDRDDELLVEMIRTQILPARGICAEADEIIVTSGTQQALALVSGALLDEARTVAFENPGYVDARELMRATGARMVPMKVDMFGAVLPPDVECDLVYVTPSHQNPTNVTMSSARRHALLARVAQWDAVIVEDDFDSEVRYRGRPAPSLKSLDRDGRVVYLGGFSKLLAPGLRLGFAVAPSPLIAEMRRRRSLSTKHPPGLMQRAMALFMQSGQFHRAARDHRLQLERKWSQLGHALEQHLPWSPGEPPTGGLAYWLTAPLGFDADLLAERLQTRGVLIAPGRAAFDGADPPRHHFRVGFGAIKRADIEPGARIIAEEARRLLG